jgi:hypothetical protein
MGNRKLTAKAANPEAAGRQAFSPAVQEGT